MLETLAILLLLVFGGILLLAAVNQILAKQTATTVDADTLIEVYDKYEHELEQTPPHRKFRDVAGTGLEMAMKELGLSYEQSDIEILTSGISRMPPFPEVPGALGDLKSMGFKLCIISNTDDDIIAGNVPGRGAKFEVYLPTVDQPEAGPFPALDPTTLTGDEHILFVDDETKFVMITQRQLEHLGYRVTIFTSPVSALEHFKTTPDSFDLVI